MPDRSVRRSRAFSGRRTGDGERRSLQFRRRGVRRLCAAHRQLVHVAYGRPLGSGLLRDGGRFDQLHRLPVLARAAKLGQPVTGGFRAICKILGCDQISPGGRVYRNDCANGFLRIISPPTPAKTGRGGAVATIADVARKAGVSVSTVSHVVNGTRRVAPGTARAVQAAIDSFGYRPNIMARSLKAASTRSVGRS